jgi:hypothetical protein
VFEQMVEIENSQGLYLFAKDTMHRFIYCNQLFADRLGLASSQQIVGKTDFDLFSERTAKLFQNGDSYVLHGGEFHGIPEVLPQPHHAVRIRVTKGLIKSKKGKVSGVFGAAVEVGTSGIIEPTQLKILSLNEEKRFQERFSLLTAKEKDCLKWMIQGKTAVEIGIIVGSSPRTVEKHLENIKKKISPFSKLTEIAFIAGRYAPQLQE